MPSSKNRVTLDPPRKARKTAAQPNTDFVEDYLPALLTRASSLISGEFHRVVTQKGFTVSEWRVLAALAGSRRTSIGKLARLTVMKQPTLTRVLDRMEIRGDVKRLPHETDRRITLVAITDSGQELVSELIELAHEHERRVLEPFGLSRSAELKKTLKQMIEMHQGHAEEEIEDGEP